MEQAAAHLLTAGASFVAMSVVRMFRKQQKKLSTACGEQRGVVLFLHICMRPAACSPVERSASPVVWPAYHVGAWLRLMLCNKATPSLSAGTPPRTSTCILTARARASASPSRTPPGRAAQLNDAQTKLSTREQEVKQLQEKLEVTTIQAGAASTLHQHQHRHFRIGCAHDHGAASDAHAPRLSNPSDRAPQP